VLESSPVYLNHLISRGKTEPSTQPSAQCCDLDMTASHDVLIVGAGLAGLAAARELSIHGIGVTVLERDEYVGGRVQSDVVDGLTLDRGFQLYNPAYPEAARVLDHDALDLRAFTPGVVVASEAGPNYLADPRKAPSWALRSTSPRTGSVLSKSRFAAYALSAARTPAHELVERPDTSAAVALRGAGIDDALFERVLEPFLTGVFLEDRLATSRHFLDFVLKSFVRGVPALPREGMGAIPAQLSAALPAEVVHTSTEVEALTGTTDGFSVNTSAGIHSTRALVIATDAPAARNLVPDLITPAGNAVTTWYHVAPPGTVITDGRPILVVDADKRGPIINSVALTNAVPEYATDGRVLISSSVLGAHSTGELDAQVLAHLSTLHGQSTSNWQQVARYAIPYALPAMLPPFPVRRSVQLTENLFIAGDHRDTSSIQGAMVSGRRAAHAVLAQFGHRVIS
jgi:glycine/D-amino acid oxidase-like deaminating enzyme